MMNLLQRHLFVAIIISALFISSCSSKKEAVLEFSETDAYGQSIYEAVVARDFDAYLSLCVNPDDVGLNGKPLMPSYKKEKWIDHNKTRFDALLSSIEREGGVDTLQWVRPGQPLGYLKEQNEFVGNIYVEVTIGKEAKKMVLEIEATQEAQGRGRLLTPDSGVILKSWEYYKANVL